MVLDENETSAVAAIRVAVWSRRETMASLARDVGVPAEVLHNFISGSPLAPDVLQKLTVQIWGGAFRFDPVSGKLESANTSKPIPLGNPPPPARPNPAFSSSAPRLYKRGSSGGPQTSSYKPPGWMK